LFVEYMVAVEPLAIATQLPSVSVVSEYQRTDDGAAPPVVQTGPAIYAAAE
jgi:hypothetical protein